ncbi:NAD(P)-binding protein [Lederbergia sp. NSJ-179]|uniref:NAD(P)-binding protein n=1 Tax=Lederbergia sp. NSJ-179 TaxID=2931402 RepID=UPI001FD33F37|nr:NAD(P)-binding protein [Lederbergia sp. NSJ-179]MCJ7841197.1 NAD(P)-binding protein [Lederbergia sp. NSJ-179]
MLNLTGKKVVVIGGGSVAHRKIIELLQAGAIVTVVSPHLHPKLDPYYRCQKFQWRKKKFEPVDIEDAMMVIAATNQKKVNERVCQAASSWQLLNVVDQSELGNFHVPAKLSRGKLTIAVSTNGASPILAQTIRNEISEFYHDSFEEYLHFLSLARKHIKKHVSDIVERKRLLKELTEKDYRESVEKQKDFLERVVHSNEQSEEKFGTSD